MVLREVMPAVPIFGALLAGVVVTVDLQPSLWQLLLVGLFWSGTYLLQKKGLIPGRLPFALGAWLLLASLLTWHQLAIEAEWRSQLVEGEGVWKGRLFSEQALDGTMERLLKLEGWQGRRRPGLRLLESSFSEPIAPEVWESVPDGSLVLVSGTLRHPRPSGNPGEFNYAAYLFRQGVAATVYVEQVTPLEGERPLLVQLHVWLRQQLQGVRSYVARCIQAAASPEAASILVAMTTGRRELITGETDEVFRRSGTSHLLSVSGLHVGMMGTLALYLTRLLRIQGVRSHLVVVAAIWFFVLQSGARASSLRAGLMATLALAAMSLKREVEPLQIWALSGIALLLIWPLQVYDVGFQLSYAATGGILIWLRALQTNLVRQGKAIRLLTACAISLAAQASTAPLVAFYFHELSVAGTWVNWIAVPLAAPVLYLTLLGVLLSLILPRLGEGLVSAAGFVVDQGLEWLAGVASTPMAALEVPAPSPLLAVSLALLLVGAPLALHFSEPSTQRVGRRWLLIGLLLLTIVSWSPVIRTWADIVEVTFIDVGQGDSILIRTARGRVVLVDGGGQPRRESEEGYDVGSRRVLPYLQHLGVRRVDLLVNTHPDEDHLQGLLAVLKSREVAMVIDSGQRAATQTYAEYEDLVGQLGIPHRTARRGDRIELEDGLWIEVLHPSARLNNTSLNNGSVVLRLQTPHGTVLLTGDLERAGQQELLWRAENVNLDADVIKVPHHGSGHDVDWRFIDAVSPQVAVIQVGRNFFGHPAPAALKAYSERGARIYRNDLHGAVRILLTPWGLRIRTHR